jgi:hypothetical protein
VVLLGARNALAETYNDHRTGYLNYVNSDKEERKSLLDDRITAQNEGGPVGHLSGVFENLLLNNQGEMTSGGGNFN